MKDFGSNTKYLQYKQRWVNTLVLNTRAMIQPNTTATYYCRARVRHVWTRSVCKAHIPTGHIPNDADVIDHFGQCTAEFGAGNPGRGQRASGNRQGHKHEQRRSFPGCASPQDADDVRSRPTTAAPSAAFKPLLIEDGEVTGPRPSAGCMPAENIA